MSEGEKRKKVYERGDVVTFRLLKKQQYGDNVLKLLNEANRTDTLNIEIIKALKLYAEVKYKDEIRSTINESDLDYNLVEDSFNRGLLEDDNSPGKCFEDEIFGTSSTEDKLTNKVYEENDNVIIKNEKQHSIETDEVADEVFFSAEHEEKEDKNKLNRAFRSLRREI